MGLEGIVLKRRDSAYTPGKCWHWAKTKNPAHPAYSRVRDQLLVTRCLSAVFDGRRGSSSHLMANWLIGLQTCKPANYELYHCN